MQFLCDVCTINFVLKKRTTPTYVPKFSNKYVSSPIDTIVLLSVHFGSAMPSFFTQSYSISIGSAESRHLLSPYLSVSKLNSVNN